MNRRDSIRNLVLGTISLKSVLSQKAERNLAEKLSFSDTSEQYHSKWHLLPDMYWTGEDCWTQRLQDWYVKGGALHCIVHGQHRTLNVLTHQLTGGNKGFVAEMDFRFLCNSVSNNSKENYIGFRLGLKGRFADYRSAIFTGKGIDAGITRSGRIFIGDVLSEATVDNKKISSDLRLVLTVVPDAAAKPNAVLELKDEKNRILTSVHSSINEAEIWRGNIAVVSHFASPSDSDGPTIAITRFSIKGDQLDFYPQQIFGPIYFAQYTVQNNILKLTAQLAPMDIAGAMATLEINEHGQWKKIATSFIHPLARTATFRVPQWKQSHSVPYRVSYQLPLTDGKKKDFYYEGIIAAEPLNVQNVKALAFSCNWDFGFPDNEVVTNASKLNADMAFFLGDQFYEPNGGFGIQTSPADKAALDYLRKWYMFGWSYRELFRNIPMVALPDDHDVYHGNLWGCGGRPAIASGNDYERQDSGGYKMPADWVNMAQMTQTSHMPDPVDPTPVQQGISVFYTTLNYGGIHFAIIEDRKFKSAPKDIMPEEAKVVNGFVENPSFDSKKVKSLEAQLLGQRQISYLNQWKNDTSSKATFSVLVSATPFCCLQTLPSGVKYGEFMTPSLPIPEKGEYVKGDVMVQDMDSDGWPHNRRDEVLKLLQDKIDLHLVGDQHLPAIIQYGVDEFRDNSFCFAVPALNNVWPRRWFPPLSEDHKPLPGKPAFTGDFVDAFGNKITVHAVANPCNTGKQPSILYNRMTGYGLVEFDKAKQSITLHCWPRYVDPLKPGMEYQGWPLIIEKKSK